MVATEADQKRPGQSERSLTSLLRTLCQQERPQPGDDVPSICPNITFKANSVSILDLEIQAVK